MIHFFPRYTRDASDTPFGAELRRLGIPHRFMGEEIGPRYRSRFELIFVLHKRLLDFAMRSAKRSLLQSEPVPEVVVITSDIEAIVFGLVRAFTRRKTRIVYETLIFVPRQGLLGWLHRRYIATALRFVDLAICHSRLEVEQCTQRFRGGRTRFAFVPFGTTLGNRMELMAGFNDLAEQTDHVVSAGKSGRDYGTLVRAARGLPCKVRIVCDLATQTAGLPTSESVEILDNAYGMPYLEALAQAKIVVVPLAVDDVSAGQMVLLQAFALKKPVIITRTPTTEDYATDEVDVLMVPMGDESALRTALQRLLSDPELRRRLGEAGERRFLAVNSTEAYVRQLMAAAGVTSRTAEAA